MFAGSDVCLRDVQLRAGLLPLAAEEVGGSTPYTIAMRCSVGSVGMSRPRSKASIAARSRVPCAPRVAPGQLAPQAKVSQLRADVVLLRLSFQRSRMDESLAGFSSRDAPGPMI